MSGVVPGSELVSESESPVSRAAFFSPNTSDGIGGHGGQSLHHYSGLHNQCLVGPFIEEPALNSEHTSLGDLPRAPDSFIDLQTLSGATDNADNQTLRVVAMTPGALVRAKAFTRLSANATSAQVAEGVASVLTAPCAIGQDINQRPRSASVAARTNEAQSTHIFGDALVRDLLTENPPVCLRSIPWGSLLIDLQALSSTPGPHVPDDIERTAIVDCLWESETTSWNSDDFPPCSPRHLWYRASYPRPNSPSPTQKRLPNFLESWSWILHPNHPTISLGRQVLEGLNSFGHLEYPVDLWCYEAVAPSHSHTPGDLVQRVWHDLDTLADLPECTILADQRDPPSASLTNACTARAALNAWSPVAFDVPLKSERGMRGAREACVPHYVVHAIDRLLVAGSGTLLAPHRSTSNMPTVLHVILGQLVLVHLPLTHANECGTIDQSGLPDVFLWAISQPSAALRVLYPGESAFIPSMHWRCMIALGGANSSFAAAVVLHVKRLHM